MAPAVMVPAASSPSIMVTAAAVVHMAVAISGFDLNHLIALRGKRHDPQPGGSGCSHCQGRCKNRESDQRNAFHVVSSHRMIAIWGTIPGPGFVPHVHRVREISGRARIECRFFPPAVDHARRTTDFTSSPGMWCGIASPRSWCRVHRPGPFSFGASDQV
jgi:hypothetical protein